MVKDSVASLALIAIFSLIACVGFAPGWLTFAGLASVSATWPIVILGMLAAVIFAVWQPDGHPFSKRRKGFAFASATIGVHLILAYVAFGMGHLAGTTLF